MKTGSMLATLLLSVLTLAPSTQAQAQSACQTRTSSCGNCGGYISYRLVTVGYDCHGCPIRRWVQQSHYCAPRRPVCDHGHSHGHSSRGSSYRSPSRDDHRSRGTWRR